MTSIIQKKTIAVIDDDPGMRTALKQLLSAFGYVTYSYSTAEAFLHAAAASKADCLVIDVQLGDISGIELARQLAASNLAFPMIFMTSADDKTIEKQALELGCVAYLRKPFSADLLLEAIVKATG